MQKNGCLSIISYTTENFQSSKEQVWFCFSENYMTEDFKRVKEKNFSN